MSRVLALVNPSRASGKTSAAHGIATMLVDLGQQVLAVDLDPHAGLTRGLGIDPEALGATLFDVLVHGTTLTEAMIDTDAGLDLVPAALELSAVEPALVSRSGRELLVQSVLDPVRADYDWIVVDCASSLGLLTVNALAAADLVVVPVREVSLRALGQLLESLEEIRRFVNPGLQLLGVMPIGYDLAAAAPAMASVEQAFAGRLPLLQPVPPEGRALNAYREFAKTWLH